MKDFSFLAVPMDKFSSGMLGKLHALTAKIDYYLKFKFLILVLTKKLVELKQHMRVLYGL